MLHGEKVSAMLPPTREIGGARSWGAHTGLHTSRLRLLL